MTATNAARNSVSIEEFASKPTASTKEVSAITGLPVHALQRAIRAGAAPWPYFKVGRLVRWPTAPIVRAIRGDA
jgi:predicted DNA-binding transcriptional regulator AlpA